MLTCRRGWRYLLVLVLAAGTGCNNSDSRSDRAGASDNKTSLRMVVMDPLAAQLACACIKGYAQRQYDKLAGFLEARLGRPVEVLYTEDLAEALRINRGQVDLIIGKRSVIVYDADETHTPVRPVAMLTDKDGDTNLTGLFAVRSSDPAGSLRDLRGRKILFGPKWAEEKHAAAVAALKAEGVTAPEPIRISPSCNAAALAVIENEADAAVISSDALPLLVGCGVIDKGDLRVLGRTGPVPFIAVFATDRVGPEAEGDILAALLAVRQDAELLTEMESRDGFVEATRQASVPGREEFADSSRPAADRMHEARDRNTARFGDLRPGFAPAGEAGGP